MAIGGRTLVDRAVEAQLRADAARCERKAQLGRISQHGFDGGFRYGAGAVQIDVDRQRRRDADGIAELDGAALGEASGDDILGEVAAHIGGRTVNLGRVLAAEGAAAVRCGTAIGVHDDLAASHAGIAIGAADFELAGGVEVQDRIGAEEADRQHVGQHALHIGFQFGELGGITALFAILFPRLAIIRRVLGRNHDGHGGHRHFVFVAQGHLAFGIRLQERRHAAVTVIRHLLEDAVRIIQRRRHQIRGFIGGVTEHDALVAGAFVLVAAGIDALGDVRRLRVQVVFKGQILPVEARLFITDALHRLAHGALDFFLRARFPITGHIDHAAATHFTGQYDAVCGGQRFAGDTRFRVLGQEQIDDGVGNLVRHLVGMAFGHGFGGEDEAAAGHDTLLTMRGRAVIRTAALSCKSHNDIFISLIVSHHAVMVRIGRGGGGRCRSTSHPASASSSASTATGYKPNRANRDSGCGGGRLVTMVPISP